MTWKLAGAAAMALTVAACGTAPADRSTTGAGAGAVTGATTSSRDANLGETPRSNPELRTPFDGDRRDSAGRRGGSDSVREAQRELALRGYDPGAVDGRWGPQSSRAAMAFQRANSLEATGRLDSRTMQALSLGDRGGSTTAQTGIGTGTGTGTGTGSDHAFDRDRAYMGGGAVDIRTGSPSILAPGGGGGGGYGMGNPGSVGGGGIGSSMPSGSQAGMGGIGSMPR